MREIRGNDISMIFQEPMTSLNPVMTIGRQIGEALMLHQQHVAQGGRWRGPSRCCSWSAFPSPQQRVKEYPHQLSGGMRQRAMIAMALACNPKVLIADEPTSALDVTIQAQILELIAKLQRELGTAVILITHDLGVVAETAERVIVMYAGRKVEEATVGELFARPLHPYTRGLMNSIPRLALMRREAGPAVERLQEIPGMVPALSNLPPGCTFAPRCAFADDTCRARVSAPTRRSAPRHWAACWHSDKLARSRQWLRLPPPPVLEVEGLKKHFPVRKGLLRRTVGHVYAVDDVSFTIGAGETLGLVGESGCGKTTVGRAILRLIEPTAGAIRLDGRDITRLGKIGDAALPPADADHLPGPVLLAQPAACAPATSSASRSRCTACWRRSARRERVAAAVRARRPAPGADGQLPAPVLGRPAPAHRRRPRAGPQPQAHHRRRAGVRARRLDPGPGHQPADGPAARPAALLPLHLAQPGGGGAHRHRIAVMYLGRIVEYTDKTTLFTQAAASLHRGAAGGRARCPTPPSSAPSASCRATCRAP